MNRRKRLGYLVEWWWETVCSWFDADTRLHFHPDGLPDGGSYTPPEYRLYQRCCRCGKFRILGRFVEMYARGDEGSWWYSCVECALADMTKFADRAAPVTDGGTTK